MVIANFNDFNIANNLGHIDKSFKELTSELNKKGYTTDFCCSGIQEDHLDRPVPWTRMGYIEFPVKLGKTKIEQIKTAAEKSGLKVVESKNPKGKCVHVCLPLYSDGVISIDDTLDQIAQKMIEDNENPFIHTVDHVCPTYNKYVYKAAEERHGIIPMTTEDKLKKWNDFKQLLIETE